MMLVRVLLTLSMSAICAAPSALMKLRPKLPIARKHVGCLRLLIVK